MKTQSFLCPSIPWLQETRLLYHADASSVQAAVADWKDGGCKNNWLIDCTYVESMDQMSMLHSGVHIRDCPALGLQRIALVLPEGAEIAARFLEKQSEVPVVSFPTREAALRWFRSGCP